MPALLEDIDLIKSQNILSSSIEQSQFYGKSLHLMGYVLLKSETSYLSSFRLGNVTYIITQAPRSQGL
jgi:hypothetical protein